MQVNAFLAFKHDNSRDLTLLDLAEQVVTGYMAADEPPPFRRRGVGWGGGGAAEGLKLCGRSEPAGHLEDATPSNFLMSNKKKLVG